jgi:mono/diheme cytochrome c family protein
MRNLAVFAATAVLCVSVLWFFTTDNSVAMQGSTQSSAARGKYLVDAAGCDDCHTPKNFTQQGPVPDMSRRLSGTPADAKVPPVPAGVIGPNGWGALASNDMTAWAGPWGISFAANLTPDKTTGIGNWTEAAFIKSMRTGKHKGALRDILPPMPWQTIGQLNDEDLRAMFTYMMSLKPIGNKVPDPLPPKK